MSTTIPKMGIKSSPKHKNSPYRQIIYAPGPWLSKIKPEKKIISDTKIATQQRDIILHRRLSKE